LTVGKSHVRIQYVFRKLSRLSSVGVFLLLK